MLSPKKNKFKFEYIVDRLSTADIDPVIQYVAGNLPRSAIYQKAIISNKAEVEQANRQGEVITSKDVITALMDGNFAVAEMLYEVGRYSINTKKSDFSYSFSPHTVFALFNEGYYQAAEFLYDLVRLKPEQIYLNILRMQFGFSNFLSKNPEATFFLHKIGTIDNKTLFDTLSIVDLLKENREQDFDFMVSLNYPAGKIQNHEIKSLFEEGNFDGIKALLQNFDIKDKVEACIPYHTVIDLIEQQKFNEAKFVLDLGAVVDNGMIWNFMVTNNVAAIEFLMPYISRINPSTIITIAEYGHYDLAEQLIKQGNISRSDMEQGFIESIYGANTIGRCLFIGNREHAEKLYKLGAPISNEMITERIERGEIEDAKFLMNLKGVTSEEQEKLLPKVIPVEAVIQQPELPQIEQAVMQVEEAIDLTNFNQFGANLPDNNINIAEAIKSVTYYEKSLNGAKVEFAIQDLEKAALFKPILVYYALMCLDQQKPIYFYDSSSEYANKMGRHVTGRAHYDGKIEIQSHPISQQGSEELTSNLFALADEIKDMNHSQLQDRVGAIIVSHPEIRGSSNPGAATKEFFKSGLAGHDSGVLFHEITHQVMKEVFKATYNPYLIENQTSQDEYHEAICQTLTNIQTKFLPYHQAKLDSCQDLWEFGRELKITLLGAEADDTDSENDTIDFAQIMHGMGYFGESILGYSTLLSAFSERSYSAATLDCEFIPRLPELEFFYGTEDAIAQSMDGRKHYCKHVAPVILDAINSHPLVGKIALAPLGDFGCTQILGQQEDIS